jgi:hypothetical protein
MTNTILLAEHFEELEPTNFLPASQSENNNLANQTHSRTKNIPLWLSNNSPRSWEELKSLRYCLYHRCSRGEFTIKRSRDKNLFTVVGREGSLLIVTNRARRYLLSKLRILAREAGWVGKKRIELFPLG